MKSSNNIPGIREVRRAVRDMPYFTVPNLRSLNIKEYYLKIALSRLKEGEEIISLKRGIYVSQNYLEKIQKEGSWNDYLEFLSNTLYSPSYLSAEYVLNEHNILSEASFGFSAIGRKKTTLIKNKLGRFHYYNMKEELFCGFEVQKKSDFMVYKATPAKALFDFLYLRKNIITNQDFLASLRINIDQVSKGDLRELERYIDLEGSKKMKEIYRFYAS